MGVLGRFWVLGLTEDNQDMTRDIFKDPFPIDVTQGDILAYPYPP